MSRSALAAVALFACLISPASAKSNVTGWDPEDLALALETISYAINVCDLDLSPEAMAANVSSAGKALGIGGEALADLMRAQEEKVKQLADLYLPAFCSQATSVAGQFGML